jgi:hypothetical protein
MSVGLGDEYANHKEYSSKTLPSIKWIEGISHHTPPGRPVDKGETPGKAFSPNGAGGWKDTYEAFVA